MVKIRCADLGGENNHWHFCGSWNIDRMEILQSALLWWIGLSVGCPLVYLGRHDLSTTWKPLDIQYRRDLRHCFPSRCLWENCYGNRSRIGMFQLPSVVRKAALGLFVFFNLYEEVPKPDSSPPISHGPIRQLCIADKMAPQWQIYGQTPCLLSEISQQNYFISAAQFLPEQWEIEICLSPALSFMDLLASQLV